MSSRAVSLLPTPLSPVRRIPTPYTSTKTPWRVFLGAKISEKTRMTLWENSEEPRSDCKIGTPELSAKERIVSDG